MATAGSAGTPGGRGGWSTTITTGNSMADPGPEHTLRYGLLTGIQRAQEHSHEAAGTEYRNFRRSHRIEQCRGVVKG